LTWTENLRQCIHDVYEIPFEKIIKVPLPLELELLGKNPVPVKNMPKVLFVGGDFDRKGGSFLVDAWESKLKGKCELILVTQKEMNFSNGIRVINNITKGSKDHVDLFQSSDIFILPTNQDAFPYVLGEAAISGLTIITSKFALGAPEVIIHGESGYISETSAGCIDYLLLLLDDIEKINEFKFKMFENIINKVSKDNIVREYLLAIE
jgi:glycosyltransferase involved in cell wall biosynthesis